MDYPFVHDLNYAALDCPGVVLVFTCQSNWRGAAPGLLSAQFMC